MKFSIKGYDLMKYAYLGMAREGLVPKLPDGKKWSSEFRVDSDRIVELIFEAITESEEKEKSKPPTKKGNKKKPYQAGDWMKE